MAKRETRKATAAPVSSTAHSAPVKAKPTFQSRRKLAPSITGMARKKENSEATFREQPRMDAPRMVEPEREVPGTRERHWNTPMRKAVL